MRHDCDKDNEMTRKPQQLSLRRFVSVKQLDSIILYDFRSIRFSYCGVIFDYCIARPSRWLTPPTKGGDMRHDCDKDNEMTRKPQQLSLRRFVSVKQLEVHYTIAEQSIIYLGQQFFLTMYQCQIMKS
jgi:hypothetical protein